jgi:hypothetical protein
MTDRPPPTDQQLDEIEALAAAATAGPWGVYQYGGDSLIEIAADLEDTGTGYRARRTICRFDEEPLDNDPTHREWTGEEDWAQVQADARFIAAMSPEIARALVAEVRRLRAALDAEKSAHLFALRQRNNRSRRLNYLRDVAITGDVEGLLVAAKDTLAASVADHLECGPAAGVPAVETGE